MKNHTSKNSILQSSDNFSFSQNVTSPNQNTIEMFEKMQSEMTGPLPYGFTNDYMFRAVFQKNHIALKDLLCAILNLSSEDIISLEITNPIILGETIDDKSCILDIRILLNKNRNINIEMQIGNLFNWPKRSTFYTCRMYTDLHKGDDYIKTLPCIHVGFVNESPFPDYHEFLSKYQLINCENGHIFSGDITIIMIDLSQIEQTGQEIRNTELYRWAKLLCATEWKEVLDMAKQSEAMQEAVVTLSELTEEEKIKLQCEARIIYQGDMHSAFLSGEAKGEAKASKNISLLFQLLLRDNRLDDLHKATKDLEFQRRLMEEYKIVQL
ncbi:MAG: Rpn family recombination-promoting nuclease/putative transposase [Eubacteriales bacterium]|nr:Rpn family recombination-promoting nuclease/putative transposase [Eubacteriales bacterium]